VFFYQAEDGIRVFHVTGVQTCALPILLDATAAGRIEENIVERRVLRIDGAIEGETQYGMLFAAAAAASVVDYSRARIDRLGLPRSEERRVVEEYCECWSSTTFQLTYYF